MDGASAKSHQEELKAVSLKMKGERKHYDSNGVGMNRRIGKEG